MSAEYDRVQRGEVVLVVVVDEVVQQAALFDVRAHELDGAEVQLLAG